MAANKAGAIWEQFKNGQQRLSIAMTYTVDDLNEMLAELQVNPKTGMREVKKNYMAFSNTPRDGQPLAENAPNWNILKPLPKDGQSKSVDTSSVPF